MMKNMHRERRLAIIVLILCLLVLYIALGLHIFKVVLFSPWLTMVGIIGCLSYLTWLWLTWDRYKIYEKSVSSFLTCLFTIIPFFSIYWAFRLVFHIANSAFPKNQHPKMHKKILSFGFICAIIKVFSITGGFFKLIMPLFWLAWIIEIEKCGNKIDENSFVNENKT